MSANFWDREVAEVTQEYPDALWRETNFNGRPTRVWRLTMKPIPEGEELHRVLADLDRGDEVYIRRRGQVGHSPNCGQAWDQHPQLLPNLRLNPHPYVVELTYLPAREGEAGPVHPRARVIDPEISHRTYLTHPHMFVDRDNDDSWACPIAPHATDWKWRKGATVEYLDQLAIWLLKTAVWLATGGGILPSATWIGPAAPHGPADVLASPSHVACRCGSGAEYSRCHVPRDVGALLSELRLG